MGHRASLAVHQPLGPDDFAAERRTDRLVSQADAEQRYVCRTGGARQRDGDPGFLRCARPGRNDDRGGLQGERSLDGHGVVAVHDRTRPQLPQVLDEVVGERVVVVEHQEHAGKLAGLQIVVEPR